jgi:hypothetical protein
LLHGEDEFGMFSVSRVELQAINLIQLNGKYEDTKEH